ncbi:MAG: hypothetical protein FWC36_02195 [Spirochaetes bacterium]|nr:hypothetical protein [Spirochaetota bacterium]
MNKTLDDYMNDPDIINEPMPLREIYAARLKIHDETKNMTNEERIAYYNAGTIRVLGKEAAEKLLVSTQEIQIR